MISPIDFGDFSSGTTSKLTSVVVIETSQQLLDGLRWNLFQTFMSPEDEL